MKSYLITDALFYGHDAETFRDRLGSVLNRRTPDFSLFRDKETPSYPELARIFIDVCRMHSIPKILVHGDYNLAHALGADGVHLTSTQFDAIKYAKGLGLYVIISTHTHEEAQKAQKLGADA
ncbi:MAG: thiamine phosphate synthase, partial [Sulfuricurvum sp.]|nr:thiamine phosphate synthase [Sulfuricurvum sp.]